MLRPFVFAIIIVLNFVLQATLFPHIAIMSVTPDTAMVLIVSYAILRGEIEGAIFGLGAGLVQDILGGVVIGFFALLGFLTGYLCGKPFRDFFKDNYFLPFLVVIAAAFVYQFAVYVATVMFTHADFWFYFRTVIFPKTIYTASLSVPIYFFVHFVNGRLERYKGAKSEA
ncbi:MAG: rod shape-determining protein MreD [Defluviitaleaceae bacterium]|nr:rod shape-determining protein MreD [Defluviitaleaceae bacterium]